MQMLQVSLATLTNPDAPPIPRRGGLAIADVLSHTRIPPRGHVNRGLDVTGRPQGAAIVDQDIPTQAQLDHSTR